MAITRLEVAMAVAVPLRSDFDAAQLRALAKRSRDSDQTRRLLALAAIYDGASRTEAAQIGGVTLQIVRDWVLRFNARGPDGLLTGRAPGASPRLKDQHRKALQAIIDQGPIPAIHGVVRWRLVDLIQWLWEVGRSGTTSWPTRNVLFRTVPAFCALLIGSSSDRSAATLPNGARAANLAVT